MSHTVIVNFTSLSLKEFNTKKSLANFFLNQYWHNTHKHQSWVWLFKVLFFFSLKFFLQTTESAKMQRQAFKSWYTRDVFRGAEMTPHWEFQTMHLRSFVLFGLTRTSPLTYQLFKYNIFIFVLQTGTVVLQYVLNTQWFYCSP